MDAFGGDFDFGYATEGEQELHEVLGWLFRSLLHDVANCVGDRGLEHDALSLQASKVHTHELARLQHGFDTKILPLRAVKYKLFPMIPGASGRQSIPKDASGWPILSAVCP